MGMFGKDKTPPDTIDDETYASLQRRARAANPEPKSTFSEEPSSGGPLPGAW